MKEMKFSDVPSCLRLVTLGIACVVMSACSAESTSVTSPLSKNVAQQNEPVIQMESQNLSRKDTDELADNADHLTVPVQEFIRAVLSLNKNAAGGGNLTFYMPAIWVFSPQGDLVRIVQDGQALSAFQSEFSVIDPQAPNMTCQSIEQAVVNIVKDAWDMGCADGKWVALLLVGPTRCGKECMESKNVLAQVEQEHQAELQARTLLVDMGS